MKYMPLLLALIRRKAGKKRKPVEVAVNEHGILDLGRRRIAIVVAKLVTCPLIVLKGRNEVPLQ